MLHAMVSSAEKFSGFSSLGYSVDDVIHSYLASRFTLNNLDEVYGHRYTQLRPATLALSYGFRQFLRPACMQANFATFLRYPSVEVVDLSSPPVLNVLMHRAEVKRIRRRAVVYETDELIRV